MSDQVQACREKYWEEKTTEMRIEKLAEIVELLGRRVLVLEKENALLSQHQHDRNGDIVVPLVHEDKEFPWYYNHLLGREPK